MIVRLELVGIIIFHSLLEVNNPFSGNEVMDDHHAFSSSLDLETHTQTHTHSVTEHMVNA